ncbi:type III polyketide synthase [Myxococcus sp. MISCRS1]|uniref:type III polyketide synthase n=1 Tax=Myxococcus TaxID=32 RepID=UPI001CBE607E|nr:MULTISPECIES: 3-oxoacyl-[acyl-carrier-protein] synthase III C-terminal domain-containing protein [unclassified Myxococcus]MBZ4413086.1 type III polyketide synthase [Myxococcus sp. XM-1-1-1]MCY1000659.1 type III polyketide synthase [Myxococcus sp. MISCRS1]BDT37797.1 type III polyketide synthase [Myxococcus sp. MH1]
MHSATGQDSSSPFIRSVGRALPPHYASQEQLIAAFRELWATRHFNLERLEDLHRAVQVGGRYLALPIDAYRELVTFQQRNDAWIREATALSESVVRKTLEQAELTPTDVDHVFFVTVTGISTPSVEARLANRLRFREDFKRTPIFGLGCVAGAAGMARAADYLRAFPTHTALLVSAELCSLTLQREDLSIPNIIASGLFGDGAACAVLRGAQAPGARGPRVVASRSVFYPDTERTMGWDVVDSGFKVVLSAKVPHLVKDHIRGNVDAFLASHGLKRDDIRHWVAHTGGPKVLESFEQALELPQEALTRSWASLREVGNLSSSSVLFVLGETLEKADAKPGDWGLMMAMGPGFCAEMVLLRW